MHIAHQEIAHFESGVALWVRLHPRLLLLLLTPSFLFSSALLSSCKSSIFKLVLWSKMLARISAFMSIIFIVQTQIIKRTEETTYGCWIRNTRLNHLIFKLSSVTTICKEGLGTLWFSATSFLGRGAAVLVHALSHL